MGEKGWIYAGALAAGARRLRGLTRAAAGSSNSQAWRSQVPLGDPLAPTQLVETAVEKYASPDLAAEILPKVAAVGTARFCLGYTEPDGGSEHRGGQGPRGRGAGDE